MTDSDETQKNTLQQEKQQTRSWCERNPSSCQVIVSFLGAFIGAAVVLWTTSKSIETTLEASKDSADINLKIAKISLMRDLIKDFESHPEYRQMHQAITQCSPLIPLKREENGKPGYLSWQDVNSFLGFIEDLGFFWRTGTLDLESLDHLFGNLIREVYLHQDVQKYISQLRSQPNEFKSLREFERLAKALLAVPEYAQRVAKPGKRSCSGSR